VEAGRRVSILNIDTAPGERLGLLATGTLVGGGWASEAGNEILRISGVEPAGHVAHGLRRNP
jgi:hypothetical protein